MNKLIVSLHLNGNANEAINYYNDIFEIKVKDITPYSKMPQELIQQFHLKNDQLDKIMSSKLYINDYTVLMIRDDIFQKINGANDSVYIAIENDDENMITKIYNNFKKYECVDMGLSENFYAKLFGMVKDKYGFTWQLISGLKH